MTEFDNVQRVLTVLRDTFGSTFSSYYDGDPEAIPIFNLPALIVTQSGDDTEEGAQGQDDVTDRLTVKVVFNKRDDFVNDRVEMVSTTERKIREIIGRRETVNGNYHKKTVKYAIRSLALDKLLAVGHTMNVEYGINPRPGGEGFADLTAEGHVTFGIEYAVVTY